MNLNFLNLKRQDLNLQNIAERMFTSSVLSFNDILKIFIPLFVDISLLALLTVINTSLISSSGEAAISAVNIVDTLNLMILNIIIAIATGGTVVVAQYSGRQEKQKAGKTICQAAISAVLISMALAAFMFLFASDALTLMFGKLEETVLSDSIVYLMGSALTYPLFAVFQVTLGALRGLKDTKTSMLMSVSINGLNMVINLITIKVLGLGILGVSVAAIFSRIIACGLSFYILFGKYKSLPIKFNDFFHMDQGIQKSILKIGVPAGSEQFFFHSGRILTLRFIVGSGMAQITANAISTSVFNLLCITGNVIALGVVTVVGHCIGAGYPDEAKKYIKNLSITSGASFIVSILLVVPIAPLLLQLYASTPETSGISFILILIAAIGLPVLWPASFVIPSGMRAAGDAAYTSIVALITMWTVRVALGYLLAVVFHMGAYGIWSAMVFEWGIRGFIFYRRFKKDKWLECKII